MGERSGANSGTMRIMCVAKFDTSSTPCLYVHPCGPRTVSLPGVPARSSLRQTTERIKARRRRLSMRSDDTTAQGRT